MPRCKHKMKEREKEAHDEIPIDYIVSRHENFVRYVKDEDFLNKLKEKGIKLKYEEAQVVPNITEEMIEGKNVLTSSIPIYLMKKAKVVVQPVIVMPRDPEERAKILKRIEEDYKAYKELINDVEVVAVIDLSDRKKRKRFLDL